MKIAVIVAVVIVLALAGIGIAYHQSQEATARESAENHISAGFKQPARYALSLLDNADARSDEFLKARAAAEAARANSADTLAVAVLRALAASIKVYREHESDKKALSACLEAAHSLIEREEEAKQELFDTCHAAVTEQLKEQQEELQSRHR